MTKVIPPRLIEHLAWKPGQASPEPPVPKSSSHGSGVSVGTISLDDIVKKGKTFFSDTQDKGKWIGLPIAMEEAINYATSNGIVVTMPELIAAKIKADKEHDFWKKWHTVYTEESIGIDKKGLFYKKDEPVVVIVNGGGILTPGRIKQAYADGLIGNSAQYSEDEFEALLEGRGFDETIHMYKLEDIQAGKLPTELPHRFGVVLPYKTASETSSGHQKNTPNNPLALARAASLENLEAYYNLAKDSKDQLGCWHVYGSDRDPKQPQGRMLLLYSGDNGLNGDSDLDDGGRFVGVAPEAHKTSE